MKIIEFTGLPGCGKSTVCDLLEEALKEQGYTVINLQKQMSGNTILEKSKRKWISFISKHSRRNKKILEEIKSWNLLETEEIKYWIQRILVLNTRIHKEAKKVDYVLLDEGFLQFITSLHHGKTMEDEMKVLNLLHTFCEEYTHNPMVFDLTLDVEKVCDRLLQRNREGDRFVAEGTNLKNALYLKRKNINFVLKSCEFNIFSIDENGKSKEEILYIILDTIKKG